MADPAGALNAEENRSSHLPQLDSLRGIACLMVLFAHLKGVRVLRAMPDFLGAAGVGIFFVLSGFLITRILLADRAAGRGLTEFYNRRVARIFPIYFLTLGVLAVAWPGRELLWAANFSFNFRFMADSRDYFSTDSVSMPPVGHFWSLCVEEHFYWFWPFAVLLLPRFSLRYLLVAIVLATPPVTNYLGRWLARGGFSQSDIDGLLSRLTYSQLVAISVGALVALHEQWLTKKLTLVRGGSISRSTLVGTTLIAAVSVWLATSTGLKPSVHRATASTVLHLACAGVFLLVFQNVLLGRLTWLRRVGTISYGLYLYHLPVYAALGLANSKAEVNLFVGVAAVITTFALAALSFRYLENPILQWVKSGGAIRGASKPYSAYLGKVLTGLVSVFFGVGMTQVFLQISTPASSKVEPAIVKSEVANEPPQAREFKATLTTLVMGTSHTEMGIAAAEFSEPTYNLGFGGQDVWYDREFVKHFLEQLPNLKRIIFGVDSFGLHYTIHDTDAHKWREALYFNACGFRARVDDPHRYTQLVLASNSSAEYATYLLKRKITLCDEPLRGWISKTKPGPFDWENGKLRAEAIERLPSKLEENAQIFTDTLRLCKSRGIECILVSVPTHRTYWSNFSTKYASESTAVLQRIIQSEGVPFFDYSASPQFTESDFFDCDHLNHVGAIKFTKMFEADLIRYRASVKKQ